MERRFVADAETILLQKISETINGNHNLKYILMQLPLVVTVLDVSSWCTFILQIFNLTSKSTIIISVYVR